MQICCTCMELYQSLVKTPESIAFIALNVSFNPCCPFTLLIPASYNTLCHKKTFCGSVEAFSAYSWRTLFLPPHFFPFMLFVQVIYPSLPSLLSKPNNPHAHRPKLFLRAAVLCIQLPSAGNLSSVTIATHLKRLSFLSISCNVFSAGLMICLKM